MPLVTEAIDFILAYYRPLGTIGIAGAAWKAAVAVRARWDSWRVRQSMELMRTRGAFALADFATAARYYVRPSFTNIDPSTEADLRQAAATARSDLFGALDQFLSDAEPRRHLVLLADSGTGKTSCLLNYFLRNVRRIPRPRYRIALVPLGRADADELIRHIPDPSDTAIFLDAFDEHSRAIENYRERLNSLMLLCRDFRKVVLTSRTQFFTSDDELPKETRLLRVGPRAASESATYEFWKLYLCPFDDHDIARYLRRRYPLWKYARRRKAQAMAARIPLLTARPMLLSHLPEILEARQPVTEAWALYGLMVDAWLKREERWVPPSELNAFSELLAVDLVENRGRRGSESIPYADLLPLAAAFHVPLATWQLGGRSLLNRTGDGRLKFAHRSIMEYLFTRRLLSGAKDCMGIKLTDGMQTFLGIRPGYKIVMGSVLAQGHPFRSRLLGAAQDARWWDSSREKRVASGPWPEFARALDSARLTRILKVRWTIDLIVGADGTCAYCVGEGPTRHMRHLGRRPSSTYGLALRARFLDALVDGVSFTQLYLYAHSAPFSRCEPAWVTVGGTLDDHVTWLLEVADRLTTGRGEPAGTEGTVSGDGLQFDRLSFASANLLYRIAPTGLVARVSPDRTALELLFWPEGEPLPVDPFQSGPSAETPVPVRVPEDYA